MIVQHYLFPLTIVFLVSWPSISVSHEDGSRSQQDISKRRSLVIVFDTTASMGDDLESMRPAAAQIIREMSAKQQNPIYNYVFSPFNDPTFGPVSDSRDPKVLLKGLDDIDVTLTVNNPDCPELALTGLKNGLEKAYQNSFVYLFTDADAKDAHLYDAVLTLARQKNSPLTFIVAEDLCGGKKFEYKTYKKLADDTNGLFIYIKSKETGNVLQDMSKEMDVGATILNVKHLDAGKNSMVIPVDDNLKYFKVTVAGGAPEVVVRNPKNEVSNKAKVGLDMNNVKTIHVNDPEPGQWTIETNSNTPHIVKVSGISDRSQSNSPFKIILSKIHISVYCSIALVILLDSE